MTGPGGRPADGLDALRRGRITDPEARLKIATGLLGASFYQEMFKAMRSTVPEGGLVDVGMGEDVFSTLLDQHLAEASASRDDRGIGRALYRHFAEAYLTAQTTDEG